MRERARVRDTCKWTFFVVIQSPSPSSSASTAAAGWAAEYLGALADRAAARQAGKADRQLLLLLEVAVVCVRACVNECVHECACVCI